MEMSMSEPKTTRSSAEYEVGKQIMKLLIENGSVPARTGTEEYMKSWDMVFSILDLIKGSNE